MLVVSLFIAQMNGFVERKIFTKTDIIHNDKIGCSDEYVRFSKQLLMLKYNIEYDQIDFKCESLTDDKNIIHTKRIYKLLI